VVDPNTSYRRETYATIPMERYWWPAYYHLGNDPESEVAKTSYAPLLEKARDMEV
jgi:hypothetical protein